MKSVQQQTENHHWEVLIESFHLSGHIIWVSLDSYGLFRIFLGLVKFAFAVNALLPSNCKVHVSHLY